MDPGTPMTTAFVYTGGPFSDAGDQFAAEGVPAPLGFLPSPDVVSTVPENGDENPYGVAFVPRGFLSRGGPLEAGDILVSNFNNSSNLQGTGSTITRVPVSGTASTFFTTPDAVLGGTGTGLSTALGVLRAGFVVVGSVPSVTGSISTSGPGSLLVIDGKGELKNTIIDPSINGPWDMALVDLGSEAVAFVSNVFAGNVVRLNFHVSASGLTLQKSTVIATGYQHRGDGSAFAVGPTGLVYDPRADVLYVASTEDNAVYAVRDAIRTAGATGTGDVIYADATHLHGPLGMAMAPNGDLMVANSDVINSDPSQPSEIVEFTEKGEFVKELPVDPAQGGSFGLAVNVSGRVATFAAVDDNTASLLIWTLGVP